MENHEVSLAITSVCLASCALVLRADIGLASSTFPFFREVRPRLTHQVLSSWSSADSPSRASVPGRPVTRTLSSFVFLYSSPLRSPSPPPLSSRLTSLSFFWHLISTWDFLEGRLQSPRSTSSPSLSTMVRPGHHSFGRGVALVELTSRLPPCWPTGNLRSYIWDTRSHPTFPWRLRLSFATDIARALSYLHARKVSPGSTTATAAVLTPSLSGLFSACIVT